MTALNDSLSVRNSYVQTILWLLSVSEFAGPPRQASPELSGLVCGPFFVYSIDIFQSFPGDSIVQPGLMISNLELKPLDFWLLQNVSKT